MKLIYKCIENEGVILAYKPISVTPYQLVKKIKEDPKYSDLKIGFAGRLDPMAEGLMVLLVGEENKKQKKYESLGKSYEFEILFGVATDTYDALGIVRDEIDLYRSRVGARDDMKKEIEKYLRKLQGEFEQSYPPYSYPKVDGKPLYVWAREGNIGKIDVPKKVVSVREAKLIKIRKFSAGELKKFLVPRIMAVDGDFRQEDIIERWDAFYRGKKSRKFCIAKIAVTTSSGVYVRSIADELGEKLGVGGIALTIVRTKIGGYALNNLRTA